MKKVITVLVPLVALCLAAGGCFLIPTSGDTVTPSATSTPSSVGAGS